MNDRPAYSPTLIPQVKSIDPPDRVLIVGNSFTYWNAGIESDLSGLAFAAVPPVPIQVTSHTEASQTLKGHYNNDGLHRLLEEQTWDLVLLQGASWEPTNNPEGLATYARLLSDKVQAQGATTGLFMTWAYWRKWSMIQPVADAYLTLGNELGVLVVPVGLAWDRAATDGIRNDLYDDTRHPSKSGTYLAACVLFSVLTERTPQGNMFTGDLDQQLAARLQRIAWETVTDFYGWRTDERDSALSNPGSLH